MLNKKAKIALLLIPTVVILIFVITFLTHYLTTGGVVVSSNGDYDISITKLGASSSQPVTLTGRDKLSAQLHTGTYNVTVTSSFSSSQKVLVIEAHKTQAIKIDLQGLGAVEPVSSRAAFDLLATGSSLAFIDSNNGSLISVDSQNNEHVLSGSLNLSSVEWASSGYGIAQDQSGNLYSVSGGTLSKLTLPFTPSNNNYALASDKMLYLSNGNTIYAGVAGGTLSQLLRPVNGEGFSIVSATTKGVLVNETSTDASGDKNGDLLFITPAKTYTIQAGIYDSAWSPNGQDLVVTTDSDSDIYNDRLQLIGSLPANNVTSPVWLNNNVIFYGIAGALWSYNIQTKTSNTVASVSVFGYVSKIYPSQNDAYVYVAIQNTTTNSLELSRLGLDNQPVSPIMQELQVFLPNTYQGCSLDYLDFTAPSVVVDGTDSSGQNCVQAATSYLQLYAINPASLNITTSN